MPKSADEHVTLAPSGKLNLPTLRQVNSTSTPVAPSGAGPGSAVAVPV
ncbi:hypothetical protein CVCC1112_2267 [Paenarthrobacter nicotinovorans]|nr:hypothetical protein CVCC1112_2267 [Paenarthrobacter nicotinovorans]